MELSGRRRAEHFRVIEHDRRFDAALTRELLCGEGAPCVAYVIRNAVERAYCDRFTARFWDLIERRGSSRVNDGAVEVCQVGATQYGHESAAYMAKAARTRADVDLLFRDLPEAGREELLRERLFATLLGEAGFTFRPARFNGETANPCAARSWQNAGAYNLEPHEDAAQLHLARRDGFEIGAARNVLSAIVVASNAPGGGELRIWDWAPDDEARAALSLRETGYPYPSEVVDRLPFVEIAASTGDFVLLRGDFVHAVKPPSRPGRVSASRFIGRIGPDEVVYWT